MNDKPALTFDDAIRIVRQKVEEYEQANDFRGSAATQAALVSLRVAAIHERGFDLPPEVPEKDWPAKTQITLDLLNTEDTNEGKLRILEKILRWCYHTGRGSR